jgi:metal-responsive CopG/Arc/MetJ family transcriptional regulator
MKTAISLPDPLFERAERIAEQMKLNRSQLYARALQEFLDRHDAAAITAAFDAVYSTESSELDPVLAELQFLTLHDVGTDEW